ncbi:MAG: carboxypeptidase regulatory-like domain-containing protein [bacterium]|nr:carboxypeptidase regulatory-like domain-containing protein [bacterium]
MYLAKLIHRPTLALLVLSLLLLGCKAEPVSEETQQTEGYYQSAQLEINLDALGTQIGGATQSVLFGVVSDATYSAKGTTFSNYSAADFIGYNWASYSSSTGNTLTYTGAVLTQTNLRGLLFTFDSSSFTFGSESLQHGVSNSFTVSDSTTSMALTISLSEPPGVTVSGTVRSATSGSGISGITVTLSSSASSSTYSTTSGTSGAWSISSVPEGSYTITYTGTGYTSTTADLTVGTTAVTAASVDLSPTLSTGQYRFVLTWGSTPSDLDLYTRTPSGTNIYYGNKTPTGLGISLDTDQTSGYGPETITITSMSSGTYTVYVHNFSGTSSFSGATLKVYSASGLARTLTASTSTLSYWNVGTLSSTGTWTTSNSYSSTAP